MHSSNYEYSDGKQELQGFLAYDEMIDHPRPAVMVVHDWSGRNEFVCQKAQWFAEQGYLGFALDMYGHARIATSLEEKKQQIEPLMKDRGMLRNRMLAAFEALLARPEVDSQRIAVIGFCFGGLCALDLARSGANLKGAVSFHGLLQKPDTLQTKKILAKILVLHGYDDPMVSPEQVHSFCQEMTEEKVDWQVHMYGHVQHAFTNPMAHDAQLGTLYNEVASGRSWMAMAQFLREIFADSKP